MQCPDWNLSAFTRQQYAYKHWRLVRFARLAFTKNNNTFAYWAEWGKKVQSLSRKTQSKKSSRHLLIWHKNITNKKWNAWSRVVHNSRHFFCSQASGTFAGMATVEFWQKYKLRRICRRTLLRVNRRCQRLLCSDLLSSANWRSIHCCFINGVIKSHVMLD